MSGTKASTFFWSDWRSDTNLQLCSYGAKGLWMDLLGIMAVPLFTSIHRHPEAMPQYEVGHLDRITAIDATLARSPGLWLTGNGYRGMGLPECVHQAEATAERIIASPTSNVAAHHCST